MHQDSTKLTVSAALTRILGAVIVAAAVSAAIATTEGTAAAAAENENQDDDPPAVKTIVARIVTHNEFLLS